MRAEAGQTGATCLQSLQSTLLLLLLLLLAVYRGDAAVIVFMSYSKVFLFLTLPSFIASSGKPGYRVCFHMRARAHSHIHTCTGGRAGRTHESTVPNMVE